MMWRRLARGVLIALLAWLALTVLLVLPLRWVNPPASAFMLAYAHQSGNGQRAYFQWVDAADIPAHVSLAFVAAEDQRFPEHHGIDLQAISSALGESGGRLRGASTITQQVAKNLYLWGGRSYLRKALEAWFALWIELAWPKHRIIEVYANIAEFAPGIYGVGAAAPMLFATHPGALSRRQASLLAAVLPNPKQLSARAPSAYVLERVRWIEAQMSQLGDDYLQ